ncbi:MAG: Fe-S cluster assembly protein SufB [Candidatus Peribacter riflensis]|uniref:Fe-S cluster assembly protein SufB n=1 Tax=Candidatus Peribacter riflensis TaxID=1735162 RepID=A0A0S1SQ64_9BACT|nr:MAG: Fe-S cluster assembly protein SufB [Candidatus Peribacter riflensis]OGJ78470.1 MAG: Fe-S cluster assembly protein SufB [Candidatus Peribacteria bacterium RIFOXYB1_FULL_57_12]ALM11441.1 MAG: Fe-S cluster assembly protein SufB [Candidatus Peribacter riflensis]ALM12543.1 MAG: Fe-S cluster assembly protein SufB [Candidatus Peribacter riflensis]ALM13644.1 MAG: Fe-S cluster assembly protein SufB [Candidatus Peribacter riflensis]
MPSSSLPQSALLDTPNAAPYTAGLARGLSEELVHRISADKGEPEWMLRHRLTCLRIFRTMPLPAWGPDLSRLNLKRILFYARPGVTQTDDWAEVPADIRRIYERLGIPEAEYQMLGGVGAQYESDVIYHRLKEEWEAQGVIFLDMDAAVRTYPDIVREHFMQCVRPTDHAFAALHGAVWSGGTFLFVPDGTVVTEPLQAYFRMNARGMGQFEHTMIIVGEGAVAHYIEGCSAPKYGSPSLHAGCVEVFAKPGSRVRYSSVENWSKDTFNLNTKRAIVEREATMEWVGGNLGSGVTMLYPCSVLTGEGSRCEHLGLAMAGAGQWQDTGAKVIHLAPHTSSVVVSKSVSRDGGRTVYRGLLKIAPEAKDSTSSIQCDALLLDARSSTATVPDLKVQTDDATIAHEATVGKLSEEDLFYAMSRGLSEPEAKTMIVRGFVEPVMQAIPLEYAVELNRLIEMEMEGSVG